MPKSDTPATRRSARVAAASAGPKAAADSSKAASTKTANGKASSTKKASKDSKEKEESKRSARSSSSKAANGDAEGKEEGKEKKKAATNSKGPLKLGQTLPKITLQDNKEEDVDVSTLTEGGRGVVLFLYPRSYNTTAFTGWADTPGCTNQACGYRDAHGEIAALGYDVYGLSKDKPTAQQKWINKKNLNYRLLCDPQSQLIKKLGAFVQPNNTNRSHFIFEKGTGELVDIAFRVKPADDPGNVLKFLKAHHKDA